MKKRHSILQAAVVLGLCATALGGTMVQPTHAPKAMVATVQGDASNAGIEVLKAGGNAVDAASIQSQSSLVIEDLLGRLDFRPNPVYLSKSLIA